MNNALDKNKVIEAYKLDSENYFQSLLSESYIKGLLNDNDIKRLQYECISLLAHKTEQYNSGDSSSIRVEKAQDIMTSNMFTIGLRLKNYQNPDDAVKVLKNESINEIYQKGRKHIDSMLASTKAIHVKLLNQLIDTQNVFYNSTINGGIKGFFKLYYPDFSAHEIHITADYPTFNTMPKLKGIEFTRTYINFLYYENLFCSNFDADDIHHLLCGYIEDYKEHLINIYEPILLTALGCVIANVDIHHLDISQSGLSHIKNLLSKPPHNEIAPLIENAANKLICVLNCPFELTEYIKNSLPIIISRIKLAGKEQTLDKVFFLPAFPENELKIKFSFGNKMEDEKYRKIIEQIENCSLSEDKLAIIKNNIHSLADLEDILLDANLNEKETKMVLHNLSLPEISALTKRYSPMSLIDEIEFNEQEQLLRKHLHSFIISLPSSQQDIIIKTSGAMLWE